MDGGNRYNGPIMASSPPRVGGIHAAVVDARNALSISGSNTTPSSTSHLRSGDFSLGSDHASPALNSEDVLSVGDVQPVVSQKPNASERTPLLSTTSHHSEAEVLTPINYSAEDYDDRNSKIGDSPGRIWIQELKMVSQYTAPIFGTQLLEHTLSLASIVSIGHLSTNHLAGVTLGFMTANVTGLSILLGFVSALDALLPQAWTSNPSLVGLWSQRMGVLMTLLLIPVYGLWFSAEPILLLLKQEPQVAHLASLYLRYLSISLPAYAFNCVSRRYLQSQGLMHVPTSIIIAVTPLNIFLNWLLVWGPESVRIGYIGAPISTAVSFNVIAVATAMYIWLYDPRTAWHPVTSASLQNLGVLVRLGAAGVGQLAAEWWGGELMGLASSLLGPSSLASHSILMESSATTFQAPYALSVAASVRIGNHLGAGRSTHAKITTYVSLLMSLAIGLIFSIVFLAARNKWALMFNNDPEVRGRVAQVMPILALFQISDGLCAVTSGVLRSQGKQGLGAILQFISWFIVGIPLGFLLTFKFNLALPGLWTGIAVALLFGATITTTIVLRTDWEAEVQKVKERLGQDERSSDVLPVND